MKKISLFQSKENEYSFGWYLKIKEYKYSCKLCNEGNIFQKDRIEFTIETEETVSDFLCHYNTYMEAKASDRSSTPY